MKREIVTFIIVTLVIAGITMSTFAADKGTLKFEPDMILIIARVELGALGEYNFIFDTGAMASMLSSQFADAHDLALLETGIAGLGLGAGESQTLKMTTMDSLDLGGLKFYDQSMIVMTLPDVIHEVDENIAGIIGYNILSELETTFDFKKGVIEMVRVDGAPHRDGGFQFSLLHSFISFVLEIKEGKLPFLFDTGASGCVLNESFVDTTELLQRLEKTELDTVFGVAGSAEEVQLYKMDQMLINGSKYENVSWAVLDLTKFEILLGKQIYGILGNDIFRDKVLTINYDTQRIYID